MGVKYEVNEKFFDKWNPIMAYVLGYWYADGSLEDASYLRGKYIRVSSIDKNSVFNIRKALDSKHKVVEKQPEPDYPNRKLRYLLRIGSHKLYDSLIKKGLYPNKSLTIEFPQIPEKFIGHFVRGYFDGDGCVYINMSKGITRDRILRKLSIIFSSGSYKFLDGLKNYLFKNNFIKGYIYRSNRCFQLRYDTGWSIKLFKLMYQDNSKLYLERKFKTFIDYFKLRPQRIDEEIFKILKRRIGREVRQSSAKAFYSGANPLRASKNLLK